MYCFSAQHHQICFHLVHSIAWRNVTECLKQMLVHNLSAQVSQILAQSSQHSRGWSPTYNHRAIVGLFRVQADLLECCAARIITVLLEVPADDYEGLRQVRVTSA